MKKIILTLATCFICLFTVVAYADIPALLADPNTNVDSPRALPYTASTANFKQYTTTLSLVAPSDGNITVNVQNAYLDLKNRTAKVTVKVLYRNSNGYWVEGSSGSFIATDSATNYSLSLTVPANRTFYVKLSKTSYTGYQVKSSLYITD